MLVVRERTASADSPQVIREALPRRVEVEVAELPIAPVPKAVHDERWHSRKAPCRHDDRPVLDPEPDRQLTLEDVEEIAVAAVDVQVRALAVWPESRPRRVQRFMVGEDLDPAARRVADDLAGAGWNQERFMHEGGV